MWGMRDWVNKMISGFISGAIEYDEDAWDNPWNEIITEYGAYCVECRRGISVGEAAWWNYETRDVACDPDGFELWKDAMEKILEGEAGEGDEDYDEGGFDGEPGEDF